jgi:XTP/dITP diphosphohydrolase
LKLYCATTNPGKLREFEADPIPGMKQIPPIEETGTTFEENATLKAEYYSRYVDNDAYVFVDDSGLSVDALNGAPGVYSARFGGPGASDDDNNRRLIENLSGIADRTARYVCVIALARAGKLVATFRGEVQGQIIDTPRGAGGFGYDPYFFYPPFQKTFAEVSQSEKQTVSHRGVALRRMREYLAADSHRA